MNNYEYDVRVLKLTLTSQIKTTYYETLNYNSNECFSFCTFPNEDYTKTARTSE